ncbi:acetylxylan esterase [Clostridium swellfunianum]|uniref:acetylxylan esterase n=1 Tax=Clostridium swellfunianum TaxID=1367462 RepID=UPI00202EEA01|nr:alpha/beta fold hydrolase [Clostridium swellfunianum]MCM0649564.1 acetylxylan esterase [Clostridium swellfunianum]
MNLFDMPLEELKAYKPALTKENDFNEFWEATLKESKAQPINAEVVPRNYPISQVNVYDVYFDGFKNSKIYARYVLPKNADKENKVPAVVFFHGYNWNSYVISDVLKYSIMGYGVLIVDVRGQNVKSPDHNHYDNGGAAGWMTNGILNPYNYYYRYVYMDCVRAVDFIANREEIDEEKIAVHGSSQGGALSIAAGALSDKVKIVLTDVPYLCHFKRSVQLYLDSPYKEIYHYFKIHDSLHKTEEQVYRTLSYFDCMNLGTKIKADVLASVGLEDVTCPPSTVFAAYNHMNTNKEIRVYPEFGHGGFNQQEEEKIAFLKTRFK